MVIEVPANTTSTIVLPRGDLLINNAPVKKSDCVKDFKANSKLKINHHGLNNNFV